MDEAQLDDLAVLVLEALQRLAERGQAMATTAVLVDAQGKPLRAQVLCVSADGADAAVERAAMAGTYRPATFDGTPATGVAIVAWRLGATRDGR